MKLIHTQHSSIHINESKKNQKIVRFFSRFVDHFCVVSDKLREDHSEIGIDAEKIHVVPNGVEFEESSPTSRSTKIEMRSELISSLEDPKLRECLEEQVALVWVVYLARVHPVKGQIEATEIWKHLDESSRNQMAFIFIGPEGYPGECDRLKKAISGLPNRSRVSYLSGTRLPSDWLRVADCCLSSSQLEGMPLSPIEALGLGVPCLLSDIPGHRMLLDYSFQYTLGDAKEAAQQLMKIFKNLTNDTDFYQKQFQKNSPLREQYSAKKMVENYSSLYDSQTGEEVEL
jgi:glycosyltransferase involved in cell wall biosynthesis